MPGARNRHAELGHFLRTRRARLSPSDVGLPSGPRRRSRGLRREDVAVLADVSPAWYAHLEQGRKVRPSLGVLASLAAALRLDTTESHYLHALGTTPVGLLPSSVPDAGATALARRIVARSDDDEHPVYACDGRGALLAWNACVREWYADFSVRDGWERNIVWWMFTSAEARVRIARWESDARDVVAAVRYCVGTREPDPEADAVVRELYMRSPDFARLWNTHDVLDRDVGSRTFRHPRLGLRTVETLTVRPAVSTSVSIVIHTPGADISHGADIVTTRGHGRETVGGRG